MIKINRFLVVGGDLRNVELVKLLKKDGKTVYTYGMNVNSNGNLEELLEDVDAVVGPIPFSRDGRTINNDFFNNSKNNLLKNEIQINELLEKMRRKILIAGNISEDVKSVAKKYDIKVIDIMKSEKLAILNTIATAEGTIELLIANTNTILFDSKVLILGFGRVAKTLAQRLKGLSKNVACASRETDELAWIEVLGYEKIDLNELKRLNEFKESSESNESNESRITNNVLKNYDIIINTIPSLILNSEMLKNVKKDVLLVDLASKPGGIDKVAAENQNLKLIHALGLPGKVAPLSSAKFIKDVIERDAGIWGRSLKSLFLCKNCISKNLQKYCKRYNTKNIITGE